MSLSFPLLISEKAFALDRALVAAKFITQGDGEFIAVLERSVPGWYFLEIPVQSNGQPIFLEPNQHQNLDLSKLYQRTVWNLVDRARENLMVTMHRTRFLPQLDALFDNGEIRAGVARPRVCLRPSKRRSNNGADMSFAFHSLHFRLSGSLGAPPRRVERIGLSGALSADLEVASVKADGLKCALERVSTQPTYTLRGEPMVNLRRGWGSRLATELTHHSLWPRRRGCDQALVELYRKDVSLWLLPLEIPVEPVANPPGFVENGS